MGKDNSLLESDWEKLTSIKPKVYWELEKDEQGICNSKHASRKGSGHNGRERGKWKIAPAECESCNGPNKIFVPTILECEKLTDVDTLETKYNRTDYINNTTFCITDSDDLYRPQKLVKGIYDNRNTLMLDLEDETVSKKCTDSDDSAGNASFTPLILFELQNDKPVYNYRRPKVSVPKNDTQVTICTANNIGCVRNRKLLRVLLDLGSTE